MIIGLVTAEIGLLLATKHYESTATIRVATGIGGSDVLRTEDVNFSDRLMSTYKELAESRPLRRDVARQTGSSELPSVEIELPANTELLHVSVEATSPRLAQRQANALADLVVTRAQELAGRGAESTEQIFRLRLTQLQGEADEARARLKERESAGAPEAELQALRDEIQLKDESRSSLLEQSTAAQSAAISRASTVSIGERAGLPSSPSRPRPLLTLALGLFLGLLGGIGLAFLRENLDRRVYSRDEIADLVGSRILASIPTGRGRGIFNSASPQQDAFARLRTNLSAFDRGTGISKLMVTSAEPGAGKSTIAANLAASLARDGAKVVVVDADLRLPTLHRIFDLPNERGLSTLLTSKRGGDPRRLVRKTQIENVFVLTSGPEAADPAEQLGSDKMGALLAALAERFDVIILDTPALLAVSDGANLVSMVDVVLLVAREGHSTRHGVTGAREQLEAVQAKNIGVVINRSREAPSGYYSAYHRQSQPWTPEPPKAKST